MIHKISYALFNIAMFIFGFVVASVLDNSVTDVLYPVLAVIGIAISLCSIVAYNLEAAETNKSKGK